MLGALALIAAAGLVVELSSLPSLKFTPDGHLLIVVDDQTYLQRFCETRKRNVVGCARFDDKQLPDPWCLIMILNDPSTAPGLPWTREQVLAHEEQHCREGNFHK